MEVRLARLQAKSEQAGTFVEVPDDGIVGDIPV